MLLKCLWFILINLFKQLEYEEKNKVVIPSIIPSVRPITQQVHLSVSGLYLFNFSH